jgi:hypothetical protein
VVYGREGPSRRLAASTGRSDHQIDGDLVIPPFQISPRSPLDRGSSRMVHCRLVQWPKLASRQYLRGSRPTSATDDPRTIVMMLFFYKIRVTLSTKKSLRSGWDGWQRCSDMRSGPAAVHPAPIFHTTSLSITMAGSAELKSMECWRSPAFDVRGLLIGHYVSIVMGEEHLGRLPVVWNLLTRSSTRRLTARDVRMRCARHEPWVDLAAAVIDDRLETKRPATCQ